MVHFIARVLRRSTLAAVMFLCVTPSLEAQGPAAIRVLDPTLARTLNDALATSTTLQGIVREIEHSDLIVHVVGLLPHERRRHLGKMQFVNASTTHRFLRIWVDVQLTADRRAEMLGHELFHAVEVARARAVVDRQSFAALYRRIGEGSPIGLPLDCFETAGAQSAGRQVWREVRRSEESKRKAPIDATGAPR
jgi:hypothetical protein